MHITYQDISCTRLASPTGITSISEYVINPYRGCVFGCRYCYAQINKNMLKRKQSWGTFVDIKLNAAEVLKQELERYTPKRILIGSITDPYQPIEKEYKITNKILMLLSEYSIPSMILTRSPLVCRDVALLKNSTVCFTFNVHNETQRKAIERQAPTCSEKYAAIKNLTENNITVHLHIGPVIPGITNIYKIMDMFSGIIKTINIDSYSLWITPKHQQDIIPYDHTVYENKTEYNQYWTLLKDKIIDYNKYYNFTLNFYITPFNGFWNSTESKGST